jgi:hypothetical protein
MVTPNCLRRARGWQRASLTTPDSFACYFVSARIFQHLKARGFLQAFSARNALRRKKLRKTIKNPAYRPSGGYILPKKIAQIQSGGEILDRSASASSAAWEIRLIASFAVWRKAARHW